ncbi:MAG: DUF4173 domain-containing protein [Bacteroidota bacterium]
MKDRIPAFLLVSLALGVLADILLRAEPWGINVLAGLFPLASAFVWLHARSRYPLAEGWQYTLAAGLAAATLLAWRSSALLQVTNILFIMLALLATVSRPASGSLRDATPTNLATAGLVYGVHAMFGSVFLVAGELRRTPPPSAKPSFLLRVAKGAALALPPLAIFCILFMGADPVFNHDVHAVLDIDFQAAASHLLLTAVAAWFIAGSLRGRFLAEPVPLRFGNIPRSLRLGITEISVVLGSLIALFAAFLTVQFRYLFGGASLIDVVPGLTYAQYARTGFFELVFASAIVLPFILAADWLLLPDVGRNRTVFRVLALVLVALVFVLMASALQRMLLYQNEFGLTELRFFVTAFMAWLALMFILFAATALRGRRDSFLSSGFAVTFAFLIVLNVINPDNWIACTNLARASEGKSFDAQYNARLGDDAVPVLIQNLSALKDTDRQLLLKGLSLSSRRIERADWRSWTVSRSVARELLTSRLTTPDTVRQP